MKFRNPEELLMLSKISSLYLFSYNFIKSARSMEFEWNPSVSNKVNQEFIHLFIHIGGIIVSSIMHISF